MCQLAASSALMNACSSKANRCPVAPVIVSASEIHRSSLKIRSSITMENAAASLTEPAIKVTSDESTPPDSWQPTGTSLRNCDRTLRRRRSSSRSTASSRARAILRDRHDAAGPDMADALEQRRFTGDVSKRQQLVELRRIDLGLKVRM